MFCSKCGREIEDKAVFCKYCGNRLVVPVGEAYPQIRIEGEPLEESTEDISDVPASEQLEESDLRTIADNNGDLLAWTYEDFDGDGSFEAYALIAESKTGSFSGDIEKVIYIDSHGNTSFFYPEMKGFYTETEKSTKVKLLYDSDNQQFIVGERTNEYPLEDRY